MGSGTRILIVEDEEQVVQVLHYKLQQQGYQVLVAGDGVEALRICQERHPHLVLLDVMLPRMNGWETCRRIRESSDVPIIILTALGAEQEKVRGLNLGADDYLTKPFGLDELIARVQAALRRYKYPLTRDYLTPIDNRLVIDRVRRLAVVEGQRVELSPTEYRILDCFLDNPDRILTHQSLLTQVWGWEYSDETDYLKVYIHHLRKKIEPNPRRPSYILTERGLGYRFQMP
jgi:two-component system KDP operon response regulator KdpE